jgi:hypothetical protein
VTTDFDTRICRAASAKLSAFATVTKASIDRNLSMSCPRCQHEKPDYDFSAGFQKTKNLPGYRRIFRIRGDAVRYLASQG